jgi:hypothetical protein
MGSSPDGVKTKHYEIGNCCFSAKHAALRRNDKDDEDNSFVVDQHAGLDFYNASYHCNNRSLVDIPFHSDTLFSFQAT